MIAVVVGVNDTVASAIQSVSTVGSVGDVASVPSLTIIEPAESISIKSIRLDDVGAENVFWAIVDTSTTV